MVERRKKKSLSSGRKRRGNMLVLVVAFCFIFALLVLFALSFVRFTGTSLEQRTAIEAAALAAARDISRIVVNTPECGWVSLSDYAPNGDYTAAADGFDLPVRSINTLIGTARLDAIIADNISAPNIQIFKDACQNDLDNALAAKARLETAIQAAILPGGTARDKDGNIVRPYNDALAAYQQNQIRMTGSSNYVNGSLVLSLGSLQGGMPTAIPVPKPTATAPVAANLQVAGYYKAYMNVPYNGVDYVFGGVGRDLKIVDHKKWSATVNGLPYQIPTIIKADADQNIKDVHNANGVRVHATAAASPATIHDPLPAPGALGISFPDGKVPEIQRPSHCYTYSDLLSAGGGNPSNPDPADLLTSQNGDYPVDPGTSMSNLNWPLDNSNSMHPTADVWILALHDWVRRAGTKANIDSVVQMQGQLLDNPTPATFTWLAPVVLGGPYLTIGTIPSGIIHIFKFAQDGVVTYQSKPLTPYPLYASSHKQMYAESLLAIEPSAIGIQSITVPTIGKPLHLTRSWDAYIRDEVRQPGSIRGGKHGGEPIAKPIVVYNTDLPVKHICLNKQGGVSETAEIMGCGYGAYGSGHGHGKGKGKGNAGVTGSQDGGWPPLIAPQTDFGETMNPPAPVVTPYPTGTGLRPFYQTYGTAVDIRFRRQIDVSEIYGDDGLGTYFNQQGTGYIGIVAP